MLKLCFNKHNVENDNILLNFAKLEACVLVLYLGLYIISEQRNFDIQIEKEFLSIFPIVNTGNHVILNFISALVIRTLTT